MPGLGPGMRSETLLQDLFSSVEEKPIAARVRRIRGWE